MANNSSEHKALSERLENVRRRITTAAHRSGRRPEEIILIAISKTHPTEVLKMALETGITDLGENRVQEAEEKIVTLGRTAARWHLVGHLQANKARRAVALFDYLHSLDSVELARRLDRLCVEEGRAEFPVLIQVKLGEDETKTGIDPQGLPKLLEEINSCQRLRLIGLMTLPPFFDDPELARPYFAQLRELRDKFQSQGSFGDAKGELSMGMTNDFEVAIEEGATMVRVGTAIFGSRQPAA